MADQKKEEQPFVLTELPPLGALVWVEGEKRPYRVRAVGKRYAVCTKPFNVRRTVLYCVIDIVNRWRAPEGLIFGLGAETDEDCQAMLERLESGKTYLSERRGVPLDVTRVKIRPTPEVK